MFKNFQDHHLNGFKFSGAPSYFVRVGIIQKIIKDKFSLNHSIVELGCGDGELANYLYEEGYNNIEILDYRSFIKPEYKKKLKLSVIDVNYNKLPYKDNSKDLILAIAVFEHLENPYLIIRESTRVLKSGGYFLVALPHIFSIRSKIKFLIKGDLHGYNLKNNHYSLYTNSVFQKAFLKNFKIEKVIYSTGYLKFFKRKVYFL